MSDLIIRLAGPVQTWVGYKVAHNGAVTEPIPTISGLCGLLAACLGHQTHMDLLGQFDARVRVDRTNTPVTDLQVATAPPAGRDTDAWWHQDRLRHVSEHLAAGASKIPAYREKAIYVSGASGPVYSPDRTILTRAEFIVHVSTDEQLAERLSAGFRRPGFMPYLGRLANAATFPFWRGRWKNEGDPLEAVPHVARHDEPEAASAKLRVHALTGGYTSPASTLSVVTAPQVPTRQDQLDWAKEALLR